MRIDDAPARRRQRFHEAVFGAGTTTSHETSGDEVLVVGVGGLDATLRHPTPPAFLEALLGGGAAMVT